jgi:hypothetical protein
MKWKVDEIWVIHGHPHRIAKVLPSKRIVALASVSPFSRRSKLALAACPERF